MRRDQAELGADFWITLWKGLEPAIERWGLEIAVERSVPSWSRPHCKRSLSH